MKKSKKLKKWLNDYKFIQKQKSLPLNERTMGNAKPHCYTCVYAGYIFNEDKMCFEPYCTKYSHQGKIYNISVEKWNDSFDERKSNYENKTLYKKHENINLVYA